MSDKKEIVRLAIDTYKNQAPTNFSKADNLKVLKEAFIDLNGGSTKLDYKKMRDTSKSIEMFEIIEEILNVTVMGGIKDNPFFNQFVEVRNKARGDESTFYTEDNSIFVVSEIAEGIADIRRQRWSGGTSQTIETRLYPIAIYEELNRVLAGRVDFNNMIDKVATSFDRDFGTKVYNALYNNFTSLVATFGISGAYSETSMIDLIAHVESATGKKAVMVGTKAALRNVGTAVVSESMKETFSQLGYYGSFYGTPMMEVKQNHIAGTFTFQISDKDIYIMPMPTQPIKAVFEGDDIVMQGNPLDNAMLQVGYFFGMRYGLGIMMTEEYGHYRLP